MFLNFTDGLVWFTTFFLAIVVVHYMIDNL
jgi:hypothetical protein